jgi:nucleotide-binding universal stress UspA family protein
LEPIMARAVLVPVDASSFAEHALPYAVGIARRTGAVLHLALVHVPADLFAPAFAVPDTLDTRDPASREHGAIYLDEVAARLAGGDVEMKPVLLTGRPADALARYAGEEDVEVVVMTTHGRGGLQRAWLGSTTDRMVRQCGAPILVIRPTDATREVSPGSDHIFNRVVAALDGSAASERALHSALDLCVAPDAEVILTHVLTWGAPPEAGYLPQSAHVPADHAAEEEGRMAEYLRRVAARPALAGREVSTRILADYEPAAAVLDLAESADADLLVLGTHGRGGLSRLLLGSVADKVIRGTSRAVFVMRCPRTPG